MGEDDGESDPMPASIGVATLKPDGTLWVQLRATGRGAVGDALRVYRPGDARYQPTIDHVGGLAPGESKPIPPWR